MGIKSSFSISSSLSFRETQTTTTTVEQTASNIKNFNIPIDENGIIQITDDTKTLSSVISNIINIVDLNTGTQDVYLINDDDISIYENSDSNTIQITVPSEYSNKNAIFSMF